MPGSAVVYGPRTPEQTLLYKVVAGELERFSRGSVWQVAHDAPNVARPRAACSSVYTPSQSGFFAGAVCADAATVTIGSGPLQEGVISTCVQLLWQNSGNDLRHHSAAFLSLREVFGRR
jgi:hypothetical protein